MSSPSLTPDAWLSLRLDHRFPQFHLQLQLQLHQRWTVLFGPSGSGKTTLLRAIAGLFAPDQGSIQLQDEPLFSRTAKKIAVNQSPQLRRIGMVTQAPALFPHLTAAQNVAFALAPLPSAQPASLTQHFLQIFGAEKFQDALPRQLSGGQQQRVALSRALAANPRALLLDEPFSAMDRVARKEVLESLRQHVAKRAIPVLMVTHDLAEAFSASDEVVVIEKGQCLAQGPAEVVLHEPRLRLLADLGMPAYPAEASPDK